MSDVIGSWNLTLDTPFGVKKPTLNISQEGDQYVGILVADEGSTGVTDLVVDSESLSFKADIPTPMGNFNIPFEARIMSGKLEGTFKTMVGTKPFIGEKS